MNLSLVTIACVIYAILVGATEANSEECTYVYLYRPVCGNDGVTYVNSGHLNCEKLKKPSLRELREGECPEGGAIIQDRPTVHIRPIGQSDDDDSNEIKIKVNPIKAHKHHSNIKISHHVANAIAKNLHRSHSSSSHRSGGGSRGRGGGGRRGRRRRSADEEYDIDDQMEYPLDHEYNIIIPEYIDYVNSDEQPSIEK